MKTDSTHNAELESWVESANDGITDFPIQNLPFAIFADASGHSRAGVAIGDRVLDVSACVREGVLLETEASRACGHASLNGLMSLDADKLRWLRASISEVLRSDSNAGMRASRIESRILHPISDVELQMPATIGDYTDFYASINHASNVGSMFRPDNPLLPNYKYVPIGYHGRASSIVKSGSDVRRPRGQTKSAESDLPSFGPTRMLDYESELGFYVRRGNELGSTIPINRAADHIFGFCLVNDWSARDIQAWEYQPLGPFLAKNFATTISPWVVTAEAVEPFRRPSSVRASSDPAPLAYLTGSEDHEEGAINAFLEVYLLTPLMRREGMAPERLSRAPFASMYWTPAQMLAHHASNGCNMRPGDLLASGTVSGSGDDERGCLLELTWRGSRPLSLPNGETRKFLEDGDEVIMKGSLEAEGRRRIGFGDCRGTILPTAG